MSPRRRLILSLLALVVAATAAACGGDGGGSGASAAPDDAAATPTTEPSDGSAKPAEPTVLVKAVRFQPVRIKVSAGDTVTWLFKDGGLQHNVVGSGFTSPVQRNGEFTHTFTKSGTYSYRCTLHPAMKGVVEVS